jgi:hypothetical protein
MKAEDLTIKELLKLAQQQLDIDVKGCINCFHSLSGKAHDCSLPDSLRNCIMNDYKHFTRK